MEIIKIFLKIQFSDVRKSYPYFCGDGDSLKPVHLSQLTVCQLVYLKQNMWLTAS